MQARSIGRLFLAGVLALTLAACAKPPVDEQKAATAAKDAAMAVKAETYAAATMGAGMKSFSEAEASMQKRSYAAAKLAYAAAKLAFDQTLTEIEAGKQAVIAENQAALKLIVKSADELKKIAAKSTASLAKELKEQWKADQKLIMEAFKISKLPTAEPADVKKALADAKSLIDKWMAILKK